MTHAIHISEFPSPVPLADGGGVLIRSLYSLSREAPQAGKPATFHFDRHELAMVAAADIANKLRERGEQCRVHFHGSLRA